MTHDARVGRAVLELVLAPLIALAAFRLVALGLARVGFESVAEALVTALWSAPLATLVAYAAAVLLGVPVLVALHRQGPLQRWPVTACWATLPFVVVFGFIRVLPVPALIVAGITAAVLAGQAAARVRFGPNGPPQGHDHAT